MSIKKKLEDALSPLNVKVLTFKEFELSSNDFDVEYEECERCQDEVLAGEELCLTCNDDETDRQW